MIGLAQDRARGRSTAPRVSTADHGHWLTKDQTAEAWHCHPRTVMPIARKSRVQVVRWQPPSGPIQNRYEPGDVARVAALRLGEVGPFLMAPEAEAAPPRPALVKVAPAPLVPLVPEAPTVSTAPTIAPAYVARVEALAISGVSAAELQKAVAAGEVKQRGRRYRRKDLENL